MSYLLLDIVARRNFIIYLLSTALAVLTSLMFFQTKKWDAKGKFCYVTGGSQGLGLSVARLLAKKGANVTIIARSEDKLQSALKEIEQNRVSSDQIFRYRSFPLNAASGSQAALEAECAANGGTAPDAFFLCAGSSRPYFWVENTEEDLVSGMEQAYWVQAWSALAATKKLVEQKRPGKLVFVGSTVSMMSFIGYTSYAPGKHALKGLAETLRSELLLYDIDVNIFFAPTMTSPGYDNEMKTKPQIQKEIEEDDAKITPDEAAVLLLSGVEKNHHHITGNFIAGAFAASSRGSAPSPAVLRDLLYDIIAWIGVTIWRRQTDARVRAIKRDHEAYLSSRGFQFTNQTK